MAGTAIVDEDIMEKERILGNKRSCSVERVLDERNEKIRRAGAAIREIERKRVMEHGAVNVSSERDAAQLRNIEDALACVQKRMITLVARGGLRIPLNACVAKREPYFDTAPGHVTDLDFTEFEPATIAQCVSMIYRGPECTVHRCPQESLQGSLELLRLCSRIGAPPASYSLACTASTNCHCLYYELSDLALGFVPPH